MQNVNNFRPILTKIGKCPKILSELPLSSIVILSLAMSELFNMLRVTDGRMYVGNITHAFKGL
jgi:hypothetical protein